MAAFFLFCSFTPSLLSTECVFFSLRTTMNWVIDFGNGIDFNLRIHAKVRITILNLFVSSYINLSILEALFKIMIPNPIVGKMPNTFCKPT
jgi:hypothetical protein